MAAVLHVRTCARGTIVAGGRLTARAPELPEVSMTRNGRRFVIAMAALLASAAPMAPVTAQPTDPKAPAVARTVNLTLEQRHVIRELVKELKVTAADADTKVSAGDAVPGKVELQPMPALLAQKVPQIKAHRLYVTQSQIVIVDPQDPRVVEVVE
jgi:hypothetical protein